MSSHVDKERIEKAIALVRERVNETDPTTLNEYREIFKKEFSFFRRSWAAAYLLMCFDQGGKIKNRGPRRESRAEPRQYPLAEEESKRLFISIGRNRRVSPREILGMIIARAGTSRNDIGAIRILDNYSFVQVRDTVAEKIIEALSGQNFRGRTLTVNYAKNRRDEDSGAADEEMAESGGDYPEAADATEAEFQDNGNFSEQGENQPDKENI